MSVVRDRLERIFPTIRRGDATGALRLLDDLHDEATASSDPGDRASYFQTRANVLDVLGRSEEALDAALAALSIDREHWPESRGTYLTLHSLLIILDRLHRTDDARRYVDELLSIAEKLGGSDFASAAALASDYVEPARARTLLERACFHCAVVRREERLDIAGLHELASAHAAAAGKLGMLLARERNFDRAEEVFAAPMEVAAMMISEPPMRRKLGAAWSQLADVAQRRGARWERRLFLRYAFAIFEPPSMAAVDRDAIAAALDRTGGRELPDDPRPLGVFRVVRSGSSIVVGHPLRGLFFVPPDLAAESFAPGDAVEIDRDAKGRTKTIRRRTSA